MKQISFLVLFISLFWVGCQREEVMAPGQDAAGVKEHLWMARSVDCGLQTKGVAVKDKLWTPGDTIRIKFLPGGSDSPALEQKVKQYAAIWLRYACLHFEYVSGAEEADVKIGFDLDERCISWSVTGTDCRAIPQNECSLNFFELGLYGEENDRAEVLRGFGHVLGLGFEHRNPDSPVVFNSRAESYFRDVCRLTEQDIADLLVMYNAEQTNHTAYDKLSIMVLALPQIIQTSPHVMISSNMDLSAMDKEFVMGLYPRPEVDSSIVTMMTSQRNISFAYSLVDTSLQNSDIIIDWGDGVRETNVLVHQYADSVEHVIKFYGDEHALLKLNCHENGLTYLDVSKCLGMVDLMCASNKLQNINVSSNSNLEFLDFSRNSVSYIDVSHNLKLLSLVCIRTNLKNLDISNNSLLDFVYCPYNQIEELDISHNSLLTGIGCSYNKIKSLDISHCPLLNRIWCSNNYFVENDSLLLDFINALPARNNDSYPGNLNLSVIPQNIVLIEAAAAKNWEITDYDRPLAF